MTNDKFDQIKQQYIDYMQKLIAIDGNTCIGLFGHSHKAGVWVGNTTPKPMKGGGNALAGKMAGLY